MKKLLILIYILASAPLARAEFFSGNDLNKWSSEMSTSTVSWGMLYGYVAGAYDTTSGVLHCAPRTVTLGQAVDVVRQYIDANPSMRHMSGDLLINGALRSAWPCPKKNNGGGV